MTESHRARWANNCIHAGTWASWGKLNLVELVPIFRAVVASLAEFDYSVVYGLNGQPELKQQTQRSIYLAHLEVLDELLSSKVAPMGAHLLELRTQVTELEKRLKTLEPKPEATPNRARKSRKATVAEPAVATA